MKMRVIIPMLGLVVLLSPVMAGDTKLGGQMEKMDDAYKSFRRTTDVAVGAEKARVAQGAVADGLSELPSMSAKMPHGPEREKAAAAYRLMMGQLYVKLCEVEEAFLGNDLEKVGKLVEDLKELKKKGHNNKYHIK